MRIPWDDNKNHENHTDPYENHENLKMFRISLKDQKNHENYRIQL